MSSLYVSLLAMARYLLECVHVWGAGHVYGVGSPYGQKVGDEEMWTGEPTDRGKR
jgi:hypothetical protein